MEMFHLFPECRECGAEPHTMVDGEVYCDTCAADRLESGRIAEASRRSRQKEAVAQKNRRWDPGKETGRGKIDWKDIDFDQPF